MGNPVSDFVGWWTEHGPNPLITAGLLGAGMYGLGRAAYGPAKKAVRLTGKALAYPFAKHVGMEGALMGGGDDAEEEEYDEDGEYAGGRKPRREADKAWKVPAALGGLTALASLYHFYDPRDGYKSLWTWHKNASLDLDGQFGMPGGYVQDLDWKKPISIYTAAPLFGSDPHLKDDPYTRNMGISILSSAAQQEGSAYPTTGAVYDAAVQKMRSKLTVGGVVQTGIRTVVANGLARLFTGALGAMVGLDKSTQDKLVSAGTWAGAISSILN